MDSPTPTLPDTLGASTGDSISILPNTIRADTPRPSETGNMSTSVDSVGDAAQQNELIADQLLSLSKLTASLLNQKLSPQQTTLVEASLSAMLSVVGGESKYKPVDLAIHHLRAPIKTNLHGLMGRNARIRQSRIRDVRFYWSLMVRTFYRVLRPAVN